MHSINTHVFGRYTITVIDNLFSWAEMEGLYTNFCTLPYRIANSNQVDIQALQDRHLKADIDPTFLQSIQFFGENRDEVISSFFKHANYGLYKSYVNLGVKGDAHFCHADTYYPEQGKTLLYYANRDWDVNQGGETVFYDEEKKEIVYVVTFKPGRVVIFDSDMPHSARPQALDGPNYRFTLALKYLKDYGA